MKSRKNAMQGDLFGMSAIETLKREIQDLDESIAKAMKSNNYSLAKELTQKQEQLIQNLVDMGEASDLI